MRILPASIALVLPALLLGGCIEYEPSSTLPPVGVDNERPLDVVVNNDVLVQTPIPVVDVLWIIDNSTSMLDEQNALTANFPAFMDFFLGSGLDYHIGVISTDHATDNGKLEQVAGEKWVSQDTVDAIATFEQMAGLGIKVGTNEKGRDPAYSALNLLDAPGAWNDGFERDDGTLHLVVISDENDHSDQISVGEFISFLQGTRNSVDDVTFNSIVTPPQNCAPNGAEPGLDYIEVTNQVGGINWSICNQNWADLLELLGIQAAGLAREYFLSDIPVPGTLKVWVVEDGTAYPFEEDIDYTYNPTRNSILFTEFVPTALAEVNIEYEVLSTQDPT